MVVLNFGITTLIPVCTFTESIVKSKIYVFCFGVIKGFFKFITKPRYCSKRFTLAFAMKTFGDVFFSSNMLPVELIKEL